MITCIGCGCQDDPKEECFAFTVVGDGDRVITLGYRRSFRSWEDFAVAYAAAAKQTKDMKSKPLFYDAYSAFMSRRIKCEEYDGIPDGVFRFCFKDRQRVMSFGYQIAFENWDQFEAAYNRELSLMSGSMCLPPEDVFHTIYDGYMIVAASEVS